VPIDEIVVTTHVPGAVGNCSAAFGDTLLKSSVTANVPTWAASRNAVLIMASREAQDARRPGSAALSAISARWSNSRANSSNRVLIPGVVTRSAISRTIAASRR